MKIVINIDDDTYKDIKKGKIYSSVRDVPQEAVLAIANGTPLPKGHGRLKDVDWIDDNCLDYRTDDDGSWCYKWKDIDNAPTIIEGSDSE